MKKKKKKKKIYIDNWKEVNKNKLSWVWTGAETSCGAPQLSPLLHGGTSMQRD